MRLTRFISLKFTAAILLIAAASAWSALLPYPNTMPKVSTPYDTVLKKTWEGIKKRNVDAYTTGLVHRPKSETPGDAVSEGVSYGMFLALYCNDQAYFNKIWNAGEKYMWNIGGYYDWRRNSTGGFTGDSGPASDADQDIALLLIFANELVKNGIWAPYKSENGANYETRARSLLTYIMGNLTATGGTAGMRYLLPWTGGSINHLNPGYFAPASYKIFAQFDTDNAGAWNALVDGSYEVIGNSPGYGKGLLPDWCGYDGQYTSSAAGYNGYRGGVYQYRDAIRVYWRLATDYLWYGDPRAKEFLDNAVKFLGSPDSANFFDMSGKLPPRTDGEKLNGGTIPRTRREHSHLTMGMWAAAAMGSGGAVLAQSYSDKLLTFYNNGSDFWGNANISTVTLDTLIIEKDNNPREVLTDVSFAEDTLHNEMYFDQFLAWFGASILGGAFTNVWDDLRDGIPTGPPEWKTKPVLNTRDIDASKEPLRVAASFTSRARWTVTIKHDTTGREASFGGNSDSVNVVWYGLSQTGDYMPQGLYTLTVSGVGVDGVYTTKVWLGKPFSKVNLIGSDKRLLVDDFADGDYIPYIGKVWTSFFDSDFGQAGASTATLSVKKESDGNEWLSWAYKLNAGNLSFDPYAGLDWSCGNGIDITGIDTLIFAAKTASGTVSVSVQLVSSDFSFPSEYQYFSDSIVLTSTQKQFVLPLKTFKQRRDGNGKELATTLKTLTSIRFQVQESDGTTGAIMLERILFAGDVSKLYTPPPTAPDYVPPTVNLDDPEPPIAVKHRADPSNKYSIRRQGNSIMIKLHNSMAGASASLIDIRGRTLMRMDVQKDGKLSVPLRGVARGVYFVDIKGRGNNIKIRVMRS